MTLHEAVARCSIPHPPRCNSHYGKGWDYGSFWIAKGGELDAAACHSWDEEQTRGFNERMAAERKRRAA